MVVLTGKRVWTPTWSLLLNAGSELVTFEFQSLYHAGFGFVTGWSQDSII